MFYQSDLIEIIGMMAVVPDKCADNDTDAKEDKKLQKLIKMTGIHRRHVLDLEKHRLVDMAIRAAEGAIGEAQVNRDRIRCIVYITQKPEFVSPSTAFFVQRELGIGSDCIVFDVNLGCSGFVAGLQIVSSLLERMDDGDIGLLINSEYMSGVARENPNDVYLYGDASTAALIKRSSSKSSTYISEYYSDGVRFKSLFQQSIETPAIMDGQAVFEFSVYEVSHSIKAFLDCHGLHNDDIDHIAFHQAQKFIIDHLAAKIQLDTNKVLYSLDEYGNTSSASIPLSICRNVDKLCDCGRYLLCGFGVGLAWGISYITIDKRVVYGIQFI